MRKHDRANSSNEVKRVERAMASVKEKLEDVQRKIDEGTAKRSRHKEFSLMYGEMNEEDR